LARGELPNIKKLSGDGAMVDIDIEGATDTRAGWSQILTGYYPQVTGVYSNKKYQPVPKGLSVFERLEEHFGEDNFATVAVIAKKEYCGEIDPPQKIRLDEENKQGDKKDVNQPGAGVKPKGEIVDINGVKYRIIPGSPYYNMYTALDVWEFGMIKDKKVGMRALELIDKYKSEPFFFFVLFDEIDQSGHRFGENSKEYNDALISSDYWTGRIIDELKRLGLYEQTIIYVTADHGFDEGEKGHSNAPYVFLATNDKMVCRNGRRQDIAPTILARFGVDLTRLAPPLDGIPLTIKEDSRPAPKIGPQQAVPGEKAVQSRRKAA
jgi:predicted AlkP superfamily phosphohydrolase/phosphomutase